MSLETTDNWHLHIFESGVAVSEIPVTDRQAALDYFENYCSAHSGSFTGQISHVYYNTDEGCIEKEEEDIGA